MEKQVKKDAIFFDTRPNKRIRELLDEKAELRKALAEKLKVSVAAIGLWTSGYARPDISKLTDIADFFNVSMDYLFEKTEFKSADIENKVISEKTGLSDTSIKMLQIFNNNNRLKEDAIDTLNIILEQIARECNLKPNGSFWFMSGGGNNFATENLGAKNCLLFVISDFLKFKIDDSYKYWMMRCKKNQDDENDNFALKITEESFTNTLLSGTAMNQMFLNSIAKATEELKNQIGSKGRQYKMPTRV